MIYRNLVENGLAELADPAYQDRVWTGRAPGEMSSFTECIATLFDDSGLGLALDDGGVFGPRIDAQLHSLAALAHAIGTDRPMEQLATDPRFAECRQIAGDVLAGLSAGSDCG